jgi:hypothetical protein
MAGSLLAQGVGLSWLPRYLLRGRPLVRVRGYCRIRRYSARRLTVAAAGAALVAGVLPAMDLAVPGTTGVALADDVTASQNLLRNGWDSTETSTSAPMTPATVPSFVQRWTDTSLGESQGGQAVNGEVYAQPLVIGSTVIVATENDWVYGLDAGTGAVKWSKRLGSAYPISSDPVFVKAACTDLVPNIGVTGTPAYDPVTKHIFFFANIMTNNNPAYFMVEMDLNGNVIHETQITGKPTNDSNIGFSARYNMERPGVLVQGGAVYGAFASHCDVKPYTGYVARVNITTHVAKLWSDESGVSNNEGGIWQSGGGIMADPQGRIFLTSGNGVSPAKHAGTPPPSQLGESVIRLAPNSSGSVAAQDFFSPANAPALDAGDIDYGAGAPVGVQFPIGSFSNTLAQVGKDGRIWLLNRDGLGGREQGPNGTDASLFVGKAYGGEWGHPAIFGDQAVTRANSGGTTATDNNFLFNIGKDDVLRVFRFAVASTTKPWLTNVANSSLTFGFTSGSPVVTSSGDDPTSAVIWAVYTPDFKTSPDPTGANSVLEAYSLGNVASNGTTPSTCNSTTPCTLTNIWTSQAFTAAKFSIPATSQGWVYVGTRDGHVLAFAAPSAAAPAVAATTVLPRTTVGSTSTRLVMVTATKTVTITGASTRTSASNASVPTTNEFGVGPATVIKKGSSPVAVNFPVTLAKGDKLAVQTSFTPTAPGGSSGTLSLTTNSSTAPTVAVPLTAEATKEGIYAQPATQTFPWEPDHGITPVPVGISKPEIVTIANLGTVTQTITSVTPPSAPFSASNLPAVGSKLHSGSSIAVQVTYKPTSPGPATGSFIIAGSSGQKAVVTLSAIGTAAVSQLTTTVVAPAGTGAHAAASHAATAPASLNFGGVTVGKTATAYIQVSNTGNTATTLNGVGSLRAPFTAPLKPDAGLPFNPDADLQLPVTFSPTRTGTFSAHYQLRWRDVTGRHTLTVTITGTGV